MKPFKKQLFLVLLIVSTIASGNQQTHSHSTSSIHQSTKSQHIAHTSKPQKNNFYQGNIDAKNIKFSTRKPRRSNKFLRTLKTLTIISLVAFGLLIFSIKVSIIPIIILLGVVGIALLFILSMAAGGIGWYSTDVKTHFRGHSTHSNKLDFDLCIFEKKYSIPSQLN